MPFEWTSSDVEILLNPRMNRMLEVEAKLRALKGFEGHIWVATSGSRKQKYVALSKKAILASAKAVNQHLQTNSGDIWVNPLPLFHVGGLGIWARAHLSRSGVIAYPDVTKRKWDIHDFYETLRDAHATLTSLVPAQIYDIVAAELKAPRSLRAVLVGGGYLTQTLSKKAQELGWPLLRTYGLTECCSQVATASPGDDRMKLLDHVNVKVDSFDTLHLKSVSLLTAYAYELDERMMLDDPKRGGWYPTHDLVNVNDCFLEILGRNDDIVKIGGESVLVTFLERKLLELMHQAGVWEGLMLVTGQDERLGTVIEAMAEQQLNHELIEKIVEQFNCDVFPFERIRKIKWVDNIPRTILGKMIKRSHRQKISEI